MFIDDGEEERKELILPPPGCSMIYQTQEGESISVNRLAAFLMELGLKQPNVNVEFWIKFEERLLGNNDVG